MAKIYTLLKGADAGALVFARGDGADAYTPSVTFDRDGNVGIGTISPDALLQVEGGGLLVGAGSSPGANNVTVVGLTASGTLSITTSALFNYVTDERVAIFSGGKYLTNSVTTVTELGYISGLTSAAQTQINLRVREPQYGTQDPNFAGATGDDDGQMFVNTSTGARWWWYATGAVWLP